MKNKTVFSVLLVMAVALGIGITLWPTVQLDLNETATIKVDAVEITDAETVARFVEELNGARFYKTFAKDKHILDNHDVFELQFYDRAGNLILSERLFISNGQICMIGDDWKLWRSMHGVDTAVFAEILWPTE